MTMMAIQDIPLAKLVASPANVRRTGRASNIGALAASIAAHGLLQNLTVRALPNGRKKPDSYEVVAGGRRLAALKALAKRKALPVNAAVPCHVLDDETAEEISLAENALQCPMHPADQYEAFARLHAQHGMSAEDIAARFGVTPTVVKQRLKLGAVSPKLMKAYRDGDMSLHQLSAFAITDDHAKQERVWTELPPFRRSREAILAALNEGHVRTDDRRAVFLGIKAYQAAGGVVVRDLFDADGGGFCADAELLDRLAREKLQSVADAVIAEGWKWVSVELEFDRGKVAAMRRICPEAVRLTAKERKKLLKLQARHDALCDAQADDASEKVAAQLERLQKAIEALDRHEFRDADRAIAGAIIALSYHGEVLIERGYVNSEDEPKAKRGDADNAEGDAAPAKASLSEKLIADLTAHRTAGLRNELAQNTAMAFVAVVHALAAATFFANGVKVSCLQVNLRSACLSSYAPGIGETPVAQQIAERHDAWAKRMPHDPALLWTFVQGLSETERSALLAHCASLTVNAVHLSGGRGGEANDHADTLARELALDMSAYWQPSVTNYFGRVSKERILEAVRDGVSVEAAKRIDGMKKSAMGETAAQLLTGKNWLPAVLQTGQVAA